MNERMLESYIIARDRFLVPNGKMFPSQGRLELIVLVYLYPLVVFISVNFFVFCLLSKMHFLVMAALTLLNVNDVLSIQNMYIFWCCCGPIF